MNLYHKKKYMYSWPNSRNDFLICEFLEDERPTGYYLLQIIYHSSRKDFSEANKKMFYASEQYFEESFGGKDYFRALEDIPYSPVIHNLT